MAEGREQAPSPGALWLLADSEHPDDADERRVRYLELMREHGHLVSGKPKPLPCGWPATAKERT